MTWEKVNVYTITVFGNNSLQTVPVILFCFRFFTCRCTICFVSVGYLFCQWLLLFCDGTGDGCFCSVTQSSWCSWAYGGAQWLDRHGLAAQEEYSPTTMEAVRFPKCLVLHTSLCRAKHQHISIVINTFLKTSAWEVVSDVSEECTPAILRV